MEQLQKTRTLFSGETPLFLLLEIHASEAFPRTTEEKVGDKTKEKPVVFSQISTIINTASGFSCSTLFLGSFFGYVLQHEGILFLQPGIESMPPALGAWNLYHRTTGEGSPF